MAVPAGETEADALVGNHEASQLLPTNPYSATKAGAEMLVMAYGHSYKLPFITTRGNNVYGEETLISLQMFEKGYPWLCNSNWMSPSSFEIWLNFHAYTGLVC